VKHSMGADAAHEATQIRTCAHDKVQDYAMLFVYV